jgi:hypothetical protein
MLKSPPFHFYDVEDEKIKGFSLMTFFKKPTGKPLKKAPKFVGNS